MFHIFTYCFKFLNFQNGKRFYMVKYRRGRDDRSASCLLILFLCLFNLYAVTLINKAAVHKNKPESRIKVLYHLICGVFISCLSLIPLNTILLILMGNIDFYTCCLKVTAMKLHQLTM